VKEGRTSDWAEIKAIEFAITKFDATLAYTDNKTITELANVLDWDSNPRARRYKNILRLITSTGCKVEWMPRNHNTVADWLSRCPHSAEFQLEPGLAPIFKREDCSPNPDRNADLSNGKAAIYHELITSGTEADFRQAETWMLDWLRRDAKSWRDRQDEVKELRAEIKALHHQLRGKNGAMRKTNRCNSLYYNEIQRLKTLLGMEQAG
jgi:hypothetical protein